MVTEQFKKELVALHEPAVNPSPKSEISKAG
jgi:hypothetical protein